MSTEGLLSAAACWPHKAKFLTEVLAEGASPECAHLAMDAAFRASFILLWKTSMHQGNATDGARLGCPWYEDRKIAEFCCLEYHLID